MFRQTACLSSLVTYLIHSRKFTGLLISEILKPNILTNNLLNFLKVYFLAVWQYIWACECFRILPPNSLHMTAFSKNACFFFHEFLLALHLFFLKSHGNFWYICFMTSPWVTGPPATGLFHNFFFSFQLSPYFYVPGAFMSSIYFLASKGLQAQTARTCHFHEPPCNPVLDRPLELKEKMTPGTRTISFSDKPYLC